MKPVSSRPLQGGFALVVTLSLMILLTIIAVGLLSLSAITLRGSSQGAALATARANARMALMLAIGELQKQAGPDQRVSASAGLLEKPPQPPPENPAWTGIWRADQPNSNPVWLVSGDKPDPSAPLPEATSARLLPALNGNPNTRELRVPAVSLKLKNSSGSFAWWVGDEGVKARVDLAKPKQEAPNNLARQSRSQSVLEPGLLSLGTGFENLGPDSATDKTRLISMRTLDLGTNNPQLPRIHFDDLTSGGEGLPVNIVQGRLKTDLSILFDRSQQGKSFIKDYMGATGNNALPSQTYTVTDASKFYLSDSIRTRLADGVGPNWGILWNYARLWKNVSNQQIESMLASPSLANDLRTNDWVPYKKYGDGSQFNNDAQHTNSPVNPVLSMVQLGFRIKARTDSTAGLPDRYRLQMQVKPVIGIWNPYNIPVKARAYLFDCGIFPWMRYGTGISSGGQKALPADTDPSGDTGSVVEIWMRDQWKFVEDANIQGRTRLTMRTEPVDFQPGEFRLFSVPTVQNMIRENVLKPGWNETGAYQMDLIKANGNPAIVTGTLPDGTPRFFWIGDMFLDDLQKSTTRARFPDALQGNSTNAWFALKAGTGAAGAPGGSMARYADLWNTGNSPGADVAKILVPERILSGATSSTVTIKAKYKITDLARTDGYEHLATWSFFLRPTAMIDEVQESKDPVGAKQRVRGWIDANPRPLAINPRWEGAIDSSGMRQGLNFTSSLIGGAHRTGKPAKEVGDGGTGNRGLIREANLGIDAEPQLGDVSRFQGLGGANITQAGGQPNVMILDVPRSPLVSIGQFQHAQLSRYSYEPGFVVGNSYADMKIPLDQTVANDFNGMSGHNIVDISHEINKRLWDDFYFSSFGLDYQGATGTSFDALYNFGQRPFPLANPRMTFVPQPSDKSLDTFLADAANKVPEVVSSRVRIGGAFNVNSTSKTAWKAVLSSMGASELPIIDPTNPAAVPVWENPAGVRFNRFGHVATSDGFAKGGDGGGPEFWRGWRELDADELDQLAEEIVKEVKERGPFRSLADFVNRNPTSSVIAHQRKGALQAAIDRTVNSSLPDTVSDSPAQQPVGPFSEVVDGEGQAVGQAGYLMQGDVLQSLGPILQARSDYFRIRTRGQAFAADGKTVIATAWCEAFVQRVPGYVDAAERPETAFANLTSQSNRTFGRRFELVSFRWLSPNEI